jgi:membrane glycosyltransferase
MPPAFKAKWFRKLKQHDHGWLIHPTGKQQLLGLHLQGNESYISSGFIWYLSFALKFLKLTQPLTSINLHHILGLQKLLPQLLEKIGFKHWYNHFLFFQYYNVLMDRS